MYRAHLISGASLQTLPSAAFNFGTGSFTVMAMVESLQGGTVVARKGTAGGNGNGGFLLVVNPDGSVKFATDDGVGFYQVVSASTSILDGDCHTVAGVRSGPLLSIFIDGVLVTVTASGNAPPPLNVDNNLPLTIGRTDQSQEPHNQFIGDVMNVSVWGAAISGDLFVQAAFARVTGTEPTLQGYWTLDGTTDDLSPNQNPANIVGPVSFEYCLECVWAQADNAYRFCRITNMPDSHAPTTNVTLAYEMDVPAGAPVFGMAIMVDQDIPAFPAGAQVVLTDPSGYVYNQSQNSDTVCAVLSGGELWALMVVNPLPGTWRVSVTAPAQIAFHLNMQTVPTATVVDTSRYALAPLCAHGQMASMSARALSFWDVVAAVAVGVVTGVVVAAVIIGTGGAALPAVAAGLIAFAGVETAAAELAIMAIDTSNLPVATGQVGGMAGFTIAADKLLLMDANVDEDEATKRIYGQRKRKLYPAVTASTFNKVQSQLVSAQMTRENARTALLSFSAGYVTASGHGVTYALTGWYSGDPGGPLQEIITTLGALKFSAAEVQGKIFHFFACECGYAGTDKAPGVGRAMVKAGAVAFFGYKIPFVITVAETPQFCVGDIEIDLQLIAGKTCADAYNNAIIVYNANIDRLRVDGKTQAAAQLQSNRDALVAPSTDSAKYGDATARLKTS